MKLRRFTNGSDALLAADDLAEEWNCDVSVVAFYGTPDNYVVKPSDEVAEGELVIDEVYLDELEGTE